MEFRKALLGAASLLALTAANQDSANAAIPPVENPATIAAAVSLSAHTDPVFELLSRTNGSLAGAAVESALFAMFSNPSTVQLEAIPSLLSSLAGLGAPSDVVARTKRVLTEIVNSAAGIDEDMRESVLGQIEAGPSGFKLAQRPKKKRDPDEVGQVPTPAS